MQKSNLLQIATNYLLSISTKHETTECGYSVLWSRVLTWFGECMILFGTFERSRAMFGGGHDDRSGSIMPLLCASC